MEILLQHFCSKKSSPSCSRGLSLNWLLRASLPVSAHSRNLEPVLSGSDEDIYFVVRQFWILDIDVVGSCQNGRICELDVDCCCCNHCNSILISMGSWIVSSHFFDWNHCLCGYPLFPCLENAESVFRWLELSPLYVTSDWPGSERTGTCVLGLTTWLWIFAINGHFYGNPYIWRWQIRSSHGFNEWEGNKTEVTNHGVGTVKSHTPTCEMLLWWWSPEEEEPLW